MSDLLPAQASAQLLSLIVFGAIARWYAVPWLRSLPRADALIALLWVHVFRYVALQVFSAQRDGFPISDGGAVEIVVGDVAGAIMAFVTIALLRRRKRLAIPLAWLLVAETAYDTVSNIHGGVREHLMGAASGVTWLILVFFVPVVVVSAVLLAWQLYSRRGEALDATTARDRRTAVSRALQAAGWGERTLSPRPPRQDRNHPFEEDHHESRSSTHCHQRCSRAHALLRAGDRDDAERR